MAVALWLVFTICLGTMKGKVYFMFLVYEKNYLRDCDIDTIEKSDIKLYSDKSMAIDDIKTRMEKYIADPDNGFTFMPQESSDTCLVFADELQDSGDRDGEFHICLMELPIIIGNGIEVGNAIAFSERELTVLSDAVLTMIENAGEAKKLVCNTATHKTIDTYISELQALNRKLCNAI